MATATTSITTTVEELRADRELVLEAVKCDGSIFSVLHPSPAQVELTRVQRVENGAHQEGVQARHDAFRYSLQLQGVTFKGGVHTRWLFHGPGSAAALDSIVSTKLAS